MPTKNLDIISEGLERIAKWANIDAYYAIYTYTVYFHVLPSKIQKIKYVVAWQVFSAFVAFVIALMSHYCTAGVCRPRRMTG